MTQPHDRRIHADALRRQHRGNQWSRFKRQTGIMLATIALGAVAAPYAMLDQNRMDAIAAYSVARAKLWLASGTFADAEIIVRIGGQTYPGRSARAVIAHPYYRQSVSLRLSYVMRGAQFGCAGWLRAPAFAAVGGVENGAVASGDPSFVSIDKPDAE